MSYPYDVKAPKLPITLSINRDLVSEAHEAGFNLSVVLEQAVAEKLAAAKRERWVRENSDAIAAYNDFVETNGLASGCFSGN